MTAAGPAILPAPGRQHNREAAILLLFDNRREIRRLKMKRGSQFDAVIPEQMNLATYYLDENIVKGRGGKAAVLSEDKTYTFNDMVRLTNKIGNVIKEFGLWPGDRGLLILQDSPEWIASWFAIMKIGGVGTHAYTYLTASDYEYFFNYVKPRVVVADATTIGQVREGAKKSRFAKTILVAGDSVSLEEGEYSLNKLLEKADDRLDAEDTSKDDIAFWNFSGGTTGKQKGVPHMHHHGLVGYESWQHTVQCTPDDIVVRIPKLFFHYSRDLGMEWPLKAGASVVVSRERTTADSVFDMIKKYRPTILINVPTMMRAMLQHPAAPEADLSCVRLCLSSGEALSAPLHKEFSERFGVEVINTIGSAEALLPYFINQPGEIAYGSAGKVGPLTEIKLVDSEGNEVPEGESGVLWVRSDASGWMYHGEHEKTKRTFLGNDWVNTNDLMREDANGNFWYMGRGDDLIKVSGVYVAPLEIEKCIEKHKGVKEVAVLGVADADGLTKAKAFIALNDGFRPSEEMSQEIKDFVRQNLAPFKVPRLIEFMAELPKTGYGKIDRRQLLSK
jgi:benzoate-CoA ligase family protein